MLLLQVSFTSTLRGTFGTTPPQPAHSTTRSTSRPAATTEPRSTKETATSNTHSHSVKGAWAPRGGNKLSETHGLKPSQLSPAAISQKFISGDNFWLEWPTKARSTQLSYILKVLFRDTPFLHFRFQVAGSLVAMWQVGRWHLAKKRELSKCGSGALTSPL